MNNLRLFILLLLGAIASSSCQKATDASKKDYQATRTQLPENCVDSTAFLVGDSISYDVVVQNPDSTDEWRAFQLRKIDEHKIADLVFEAIYAGKLKAYHYTTEEEMSIAEVREMESHPENSRDRMAKMQFQERWFFDPQSLQFVKKVSAIMLAYEINGMENRYRAGVLVKFPEQENEKKELQPIVEVSEK